MSSLMLGVIDGLHTVISIETTGPRSPAPVVRPVRSRTSATRKQDLQVRCLTVAGDAAAL